MRQQNGNWQFRQDKGIKGRDKFSSGNEESWLEGRYVLEVIGLIGTGGQRV